MIWYAIAAALVLSVLIWGIVKTIIAEEVETLRLRMRKDQISLTRFLRDEIKKVKPAGTS